MLELAKPALDVGLFTNNLEPALDFWQRSVGLPFSELLPVGGGVRQHRHAAGDSVIKVNHAREVLAGQPASPIRCVRLARKGQSAAQSLTSEHGVQVELISPGEDGVEQLAVVLACRDVDAQRRFYVEVLGLPEGEPGYIHCGASRIELRPGGTANPYNMRAPGYRYLTVQVHDVRAVHEQVLAAGGREGRPPVKLGDVAHISFVLDADGTWIELSQRKSLTGSLD